MTRDDRPDPDQLMQSIADERDSKRRASLRIFLGMSAGVGKTYAMLKAAHQRRLEKIDIVVGLVETHGRSETAALLDGLEIIPRKKIDYRGTAVEEMDLDAILSRRPSIVVVDELAHSNLPGERHSKRYQDVLELLDAGIQVYTAINVQHLESRKDAVEAITQIAIRETVPDSLLDRASQVELVDVAPVELLKRLSEGKVYLGDRAQRATDNFFKEDRLTALREIALRLTAERVDQDLQRFVVDKSASGPWQTNERVMVAISHSPFSEKLVRAARRLAYNLEAPWIGVHVDSGVTLNAEDQQQLKKNLTLARELKAEIVTTTDTDVSAALKRIARQKNVTQILVGRPTRRWLRDLIEGGTLLDRLVRESSEIDVHVLRQEGGTARSVSLREAFQNTNFVSRPIQYWNTLIFLCGVGIFGTLLNPYLGYRTIGFVFLLSVLLVGMVAPLGPVIFAAVLSAFGWNFFFIPPRFTFVINSGDDMSMCISFFIVAMIMGYLTHRIRFHQKLIREREERTTFLYEILRDISNSAEKSEFLKKVVRRVGVNFKSDCGVFLADRSGRLQFKFDKTYSISLDEKSQAVATWAFESGKSAGWSTQTLADAKALYLPLKGLSSNWGVFVYAPHEQKPLTLDQEGLLLSIVHQLALSLERHFFEKRSHESKQLAESEKLHQTLLNSISHEMRTPLTAIIGGVSVLEDPKQLQNLHVVKEVVSQLGDAGDRLNRVIENLLDMSRLNSGMLALKVDWCDVADLIGVVLQKVVRPLGQHVIKTQIPENLPEVKIDFRLMEHAIANLIVNASAYSPSGTEILVSAESFGEAVKIRVDDSGPGIPESHRTEIFEKFFRLPGTPAGGTGLGLSIVKSIVEANGGTVGVETNKKGGASFVITLFSTMRPTMEGEGQING